MLSKIALTLGGLFLTFVLAVAAGLGVWTYSLNTQLAGTRADLQALKSSNEKLKADFNDLSTGCAKTSADLKAAQAQTESLQGQLEKAQAENDSLRTKISAIQAKVSILYAWQFGSEEAFDRKVNASDDAELKALWEKARNTDSKDDYWKVMDYLIQSIADMTGLTALPTLVQNGALIKAGSVAFADAIRA